jgi:hypothetical protein
MPIIPSFPSADRTYFSGISVILTVVGLFLMPSCEKNDATSGSATTGGENRGAETSDHALPADVLKRTSLSLFGGETARLSKRGTTMVSTGGKYGPEGTEVHPVKFEGESMAFYFSQDEFGDWFYTYDGIGVLVPVPSLEEIAASRKAEALKQQQAKEDAKTEEATKKELARWQEKELERKKQKDAERLRLVEAEDEAERKRLAETVRLDRERTQRERDEIAKNNFQATEDRAKQREEQERAVAREIEETRRKLGQGSGSSEQSEPDQMPIAPSPNEVPSAPKISPPSTDKAVRLAEAKAELAALESKISTERQRFQQATDTINRLTNFKKTPVKEGSAAYRQCMDASRVIQEVEQKAPGMTTEKSRLTTLIAELEKE